MFLHSLRNAFVKLDIQGTDKKAVFENLLEGVNDALYSKNQKKSFLELLLKREEIGTTAVGDQLALPHAFSSELSEPVVVFGVSADGVDMGSLDGNLVHVFLMVLLPDSDAGRAAKREIFQRALIVFSDRFIRQQLRQARSAADVLEIMTREEAFSRANESVAVH